MTDLRITSVGFTNASSADIRTGLLGWLTFVLNDTLMVDGVTVRRTREGRTTLSYPARRDAAGQQHFFIRPIDDGARHDLERQIFAKLGIEQEVAP